MKIHSYESLAALDGEGLRYGIFLTGCPLKCAYCHNPDTQGGSFTEERSAEELCRKIKRYKPYFKAGRGGVTLSGGEPLLWAEEIAELGKLLRAEGIEYTLDTSGHIRLTDAVKAAVRGASLVILDLKFPTEEDYKRYTGGSFATVKSFLDFASGEGIPLWIRTVIVPEINDTKEALDQYLEVLLPYADSIGKYELLPFHTMGFHKYEALGIKNPLADTPPMDKAAVAELNEYANKILLGARGGA